MTPRKKPEPKTPLQLQLAEVRRLRRLCAGSDTVLTRNLDEAERKLGQMFADWCDGATAPEGECDG